MSAELLRTLVELTIAMSVGIVIVALMRKPVRHLAGARAAYWLWLLIPASMLAVLIPAPETVPAFITLYFAPATSAPLNMSAAVGEDSMHLAPWLLALWLAGGALTITLAVGRQRTFMRFVGKLTPGPDGTLRSPNVSSPMLVGVWRPKIVLPVNFEDQYDAEERAMVLAHEEAHCRRGDAPANALATLGVCSFWPNPLMHWAIGRFRFDQELACDALVLSANERSRRRYADALLKAQLATESGSRMPAACHWQSAHPLKERIAMLKNPLPGRVRRATGIAAICTVIGFSSYSVWAMQAGEANKGPRADGSLGYSIYADEVTRAADGGSLMNGHVTLRPLPGSPAPKMSARKIEVDPQGVATAEGLVVIRLGGSTVTGERAVQTADGVITMDAARSVDLFVEGSPTDRSAKPRDDFRPPADPAQDVPAIVSAVDLGRWFPQGAASEGVEGTVLISVLLDESGRPTDTRVLSESPAGYGFAAAASTAAHFFQYRNPTGRPTELTFNMKFALDHDKNKEG